MKCPKCGYLGFETSDRCKHCGYDFSLTLGVDAPAELPLRSGDDAGGPLADFDLSETGASRDAGVVQAADPVLAASSGSPAATPRSAATPRPSRTPPAHRSEPDALPLFALDERDDAPSMTPPPARPPLSVRRTTPEIPRGRARVTPSPRVAETEPAAIEQSPPLAEPAVLRAETVRHAAVEQPAAASRVARATASILDAALLALIDAAVIYLTLALAGLGTEAVMQLPLLPLAGFFLILNGGYLIAFVAASGQTIGKMVMGIRVIGDDGHRVAIGGAVLRATGCLLSLLTAGLGYLPAFVTADGRALQDRMSGTRVVSAR